MIFDAFWHIFPYAPVRGECFAPPPSPRGSAPSWEAKLCVASACFKRDVFMILLSDHHKNGAKHSPPGPQGAPDCPGPHPPLRFPGPPLIHDISTWNPWNKTNSSWIPIFFGALLDGIKPVAARGPEPLEESEGRHRTSKFTSNQCSQNWCRMTSVASLYHVMHLECISKVSGCIWVIFMTLQKS